MGATGPHFENHWWANSQPEETRLTMVDAEVLELCTSMVTRMPSTSPATGLDMPTDYMPTLID